MVRLYRLSIVGLPITRQQAIQRVVDSARVVGQHAHPKTVYVSYCNKEAEVATKVAAALQEHGISAWVATQDCKVGDNWRQAQARGVMSALIQVVVLDESIVDANVLRTEIMLAEAFGLPVVTVLGSTLAQDERSVARVMQRLRSSDITYRRLTDVQPFRCDEQSVSNLVNWVRTSVSSTRA